jgi:hypothetical protein
MTRVMTAVSNGLNNYVLSLEDAQAVLEPEWAKLDADIDLDELSEAEMDELDRINQHQRGTQYGASEENEIEGNPRVGQNGGGSESGETADPSDPA